MTNGEKFREVFSISQVDEGELYAFAWLPNHDAAEISIDWWNAEYKEPTPKNNLGVDTDKLIADCEKMSFDFELFGRPLKALLLDAVKNIVKDMPPVTPQEPRKGHWIKIGDRGFGYSDIVICKCSECEYQTEFVGKFDGHNLVIDAERADNYCSNCGSDNREVKE